MLLLTLAVTQGGELAQAAIYKTNDIVTNFTFVARRQFTRPDGTIVPAGSAVQLSDFTGRIVFLEWFAVWCPYCVAAAPQVKTGIADWYAARGGNPYGVPVLHIGVNQESASSYQSQTDSFVTQQGFNPVVNDYGPGLGTNRVRFMFQSSGQPIFAVINCLTNSPSHQPWQLLVNHLGYGDTQFGPELASFRAAIDTVQAPLVAPQLSAAHLIGSAFEFTLQTQRGRSYRVQGSTNLNDWTTLRTIAGTNAPVLFRDTNAPAARRFYRTVTP
jgi:thiol-disulfide isomerase/thioredoxin